MSAQQTVGEIAALTPVAAGVFEKYGIDYCCGGRRTLGEACRERGISAEAVLAEVEDSGRGNPARNWREAGAGELIAHIVATHHAYLQSELPALSARAAKVAEAHGGRHPGIVLPLQAAFEALRAELESHLRKEEMVLFPAIQAMEASRAAGRAPAPLPFGTVRNPIRMMEFEHDNAGGALAEMRRLTDDYAPPEDACATFRALYEGLKALEADLHQHIHLENNVLFPMAVALEGR